MTEKGFEFRSAFKEKSARAAFKIFDTSVTAFHAFLTSTKDLDQINRKVKDLVLLAEKTELELNSWLELVKHTPQAELASELLSNMNDSMQGVQGATLNKVLTLDEKKDETMSVRSGSSRKSYKSKMSIASGSSRRSSKETLIDVKARRAALEQKLKFSDEIEEQQKNLNKLKLQQELSETLAEEAVYEEALKSEERPLECHGIELPKETPEQMFERFMNHRLDDPAHLTATNLSPPVINTSCVDAQDPIFPALYSPTGIINPVNRQVSANQQPAATTADLLHTTASGNQSILDLGTGHQANLYPEINNPGNPRDHENYPTASQPLAAFVNVGTSSTCHASSQHITKSQTIVSASLAGTSTPLQSLPLGNVNTSVTYQHPACTISSLKPAYPKTHQLSRDATSFTPNSSPATQYREITPSPFIRNLNSAHPSTDNVSQIAEALAKVTQLQRLPQAQPDVFTGDETDTRFFIWETAFDALIDSAPINSQQKLYLLYQHLGGKAKKVVEQLQYMVAASPEIAYNEARKKLKSRFGRPAIIASDFENKLANWPKIANNDAQAFREYSDFLQQVEIAKTQLHSLKIFEFPSQLQTLVDKLPNWFLTKWSTKVQSLQQERGSEAFPTSPNSWQR